MTIEQLIKYIKESKQHSCLYHFTDKKNLPSIRQHGLLSTSDRQINGVIPETRGGDAQSHASDVAKGITGFVCLSFTDNHPLRHINQTSGTVPNSIYLEISADILKIKGVKFADGVSYAADTNLLLLSDPDTIKKIDTKVIYKETDWQDDEIKIRRKAAKKAEILVPDCVPVDMIISGL